MLQYNQFSIIPSEQVFTNHNMSTSLSNDFVYSSENTTLAPASSLDNDDATDHPTFVEQ